MSRISPPQTVLGQLQRGRGAGWLAASRSNDGSNLLLECLVSDPRWDRQVEQRDDYYGSLARELNLPAATIAAAPTEGARSLRLGVLAVMARRGDLSAIDLLRDRFRDDGDKQSIAYLLSTIPNGLDGLDRLIMIRLDEDALADFIEDTRTMLPWDRWADADRFIARAVSRFDAKLKTMRPTPPDLDAPLDVILAHDWRTPADAVVGRFVDAPNADEIARLRQAAIGPTGPARYFALRVLGARKDPCALDLAEKTLAADTSGRARATAYRYVKALDATDTLPLARRWLGAEDSRSSVAAALMALHSTDSDVPSIRSALGRAWRDQSMYDICGLVDALGRHPATAPYEELRTVFAEVNYSYGRKRAAAAMAKVDAEFVKLYSQECLWDCEPGTQMIGVETADIAQAETVNRIRYLATSESEYQEVALAAVGRLNRL